MLVRYEPPLHDFSYVVQAPLLLDIDGACGGWIERWSLEGLVPAPDMKVSSGNAVLTIPFQGFGISLQCQLDLDTTENILRFVDLGERESHVLRHFYRQIVTGRAVSVNQIITAMEAPAEKIPMEQTPEESEFERQRKLPRIMRTCFAIGVYALLGVIAYQPVVLPLYDAVRSEFATSESAKLQ